MCSSPGGSLAGLELGVVEMFVLVAPLEEAVWVQLHVCHFSLGSVEAEFCFPVPLGWELHLHSFWIQMPEFIVLVAAVSGAGGSSRDRLLLLVGERGL